MDQPSSLNRLGQAEPLVEQRAARWEDGRSTDRPEIVAEEVPVAIAYNGQPHVVMMATPGDLDDFALGFSVTEQLIETPADLLAVETIRYSQGIELQVAVSARSEPAIQARNRRLVGRTGCGICGADSVKAVLRDIVRVGDSIRVTHRAIDAAVAELPHHQRLNQAAGAVHAAGWADLAGRIGLVREDDGRHNAHDKLIGANHRAGIDPAAGFPVVTSRASFEMVQKTMVLGAEILVAVSGPTGLAIRMAEAANLTLVGFARPGRHTSYTHGRRVGAADPA